MNLAIVGATGLVGRNIISVLEEYNINIDKLILIASEKSIGNNLVYKGNLIHIFSLDYALNNFKIDYAIFCAGKEISKKYIPIFINKGIIVIDNSSAYRMQDNIPLVVPEINFNTINSQTKIISNPNCSTIQLVMVLFTLHKLYDIKRVVISTYQSVTGSGMRAVEQLNNESKIGYSSTDFYPYKIDRNLIPHCDIFNLDNFYSEEELKLIRETNKIMSTNISITCTAVRVPVLGGHSESVNIEFNKNYNLDELKLNLSNVKGVIVKDDVKNNIYPMPYYSKNSNYVYVGRIRRDFSVNSGLNCWIVADNLRKGSATNAVQILQKLIINYSKDSK